MNKHFKFGNISKHFKFGNISGSNIAIILTVISVIAVTGILIWYFKYNKNELSSDSESEPYLGPKSAVVPKSVPKVVPEAVAVAIPGTIISPVSQPKTPEITARDIITRTSQPIAQPSTYTLPPTTQGAPQVTVPKKYYFVGVSNYNNRLYIKKSVGSSCALGDNVPWTEAVSDYRWIQIIQLKDGSFLALSNNDGGLTSYLFHNTNNIEKSTDWIKKGDKVYKWIYQLNDGRLIYLSTGGDSNLYIRDTTDVFDKSKDRRIGNKKFFSVFQFNDGLFGCLTFENRYLQINGNLEFEKDWVGFGPTAELFYQLSQVHDGSYFKIGDNKLAYTGPTINSCTNYINNNAWTYITEAFYI